jgi:hypothetical protein
LGRLFLHVGRVAVFTEDALERVSVRGGYWLFVASSHLSSRLLIRLLLLFGKSFEQKAAGHLPRKAGPTFMGSVLSTVAICKFP